MNMPIPYSKEYIDEKLLGIIKEVKYITAEELYESDVEEPEWLIDKIVSKKGITMFAGEQATSKSLLSLHIACCIATGTPVLGEFPTKKGRVLYIDEENREIGMKDRYVRVIKGLENKNYKLDIDFMICKNIKLDDTLMIAALDEYIKERKPDLIICDSMVRMMTKDEDKAKDVRKVFDVIKNLDTAWLLLHHMRKGGNSIKDIRGSGDFVNMCDNVFNLIRRAGIHTFALRQTKSRGSTLIPGVEYHIIGNEKEPIKFGFMADIHSEKAETGEALINDVEKWLITKKMTIFKNIDVKNEFGETDYAVRQALNGMIAKGSIINAGKGKWKNNQNQQKLNIDISEEILN